MLQYDSEIAGYYARNHLTLVERNDAYAAAVRFANDRGVSHKSFLSSEFAGRVTAKGIYVPTKDDRVLPLHCDPAEVAVIQEEHPGADVWDSPCEGSYTRTENGECSACGRVFCTDTNRPMLAEIAGEDECQCEGHCAVCRVSKDTQYFVALVEVRCRAHATAPAATAV